MKTTLTTFYSVLIISLFAVASSCYAQGSVTESGNTEADISSPLGSAAPFSVTWMTRASGSTWTINPGP